MSTTQLQKKIEQLEKEVNTLSLLVDRFIPTDDEGVYTDAFHDKIAESSEDIAEGRVTQIGSARDLLADDPAA